MSKAMTDLLGRLQGTIASLVGMRDRVSKLDETPPAAQVPTVEDLAVYKQLLEEGKGAIAQLEEEFKKENPPPAAVAGVPTQSVDPTPKK